MGVDRRLYPGLSVDLPADVDLEGGVRRVRPLDCAPQVLLSFSLGLDRRLVASRSPLLPLGGEGLRADGRRLMRLHENMPRNTPLKKPKKQFPLHPGFSTLDSLPWHPSTLLFLAAMGMECPSWRADPFFFSFFD